eukprot:CAMPEP_0171194404 /NCGR_PEP_ID=MMETSP0790-20130122/20873_1 /TAXON_ID=2925 /ORGANISM="Alexandrium catenella, Strain OF101" /LENGTH=302 /DNA_ID=CAMNT_0011659603 /DNA_START=103 /DNA_END=1008 /DNA_ORIENTATION=-
MKNGGGQLSCERPLGRHIQLKWPIPAGLGDRIFVFDWLMDLAHWNNATAHILGGRHGADQWLGQHSLVVNQDWSHYFSVPHGCGQGPFNEVEDFAGCREVDDKNTDFSRPLFNSTNGCVNLRLPYVYRTARGFPIPAPEDSCHVGIPDQAHAHARQAVAEKGLPESFGTAHVRRCDRGGRPGCTSPASVASAICGVTGVGTWVIFYYAEHGYKDQLANALASSCNPTVVFEDDMSLNPFQDGDNFYAFQVANAIMSMSIAKVQARDCPGGSPIVTKDGLYDHLAQITMSLATSAWISEVDGT